MLLTILSTLSTIALATFVVPLPSGPYGVSIQDALLTDYNRHDPYLNLSYSRVPISIISPTGSVADCEPVLRPYMPALTAEAWEKEILAEYGLEINNTLTQTQLLLCEPQALNYSTPVVLFASGAGVPRYLYNILGSAIVAKTGYTVITYDVPGQTLIVQFPDGSVQYVANGALSQTATNGEAVAVDTQDGLIVLDAVFGGRASGTEDSVNVTSNPQLPPQIANISQAAMIGHSQGGAAALVGLLADPRLSSAANMDGGLNATADAIAVCSDSQTRLNCNSPTTQKPFMFLEHQDHNQSNSDGWADVWANVLQGSKWQVELNGSQHSTFGDFPYIIDLYGVRERADANEALIDSVLGSVAGTEVLEVVSKLFGAFLGYGFNSSSQSTAVNITAVVEELSGFGLEIKNQTIVTPQKMLITKERW